MVQGIEEVKKTVDFVFKEMDKVIVGQRELLNQMLIGMFCDGHVLMEGYPGNHVFVRL